jgi:hypothetical protein
VVSIITFYPNYAIGGIYFLDTIGIFDLLCLTVTENFNEMFVFLLLSFVGVFIEL